jgi:small conductance mechanosensitive channel
MDLFNTHLLDYDGITLHIPNGKVFGDMIVNITQAGRRRIDLTFGVDYEDDLDLALALLVDIAKADERVMPDPAPWSKVTGLADSSVNVTLRCWTHPDVWMNTKFDLVKQVKETFEASGLSFPYPHQVAVDRAVRKLDVRLENGSAAANR